MTQILLIGGTTVYTKLEVWEVRQYLQGADKGGAINGFSDSAGTNAIIINTKAIAYIVV